MEGVIHLKDIPEEYVQLKDELLFDIVNSAVKICGSFGKLSKKINVSWGRLLKFHSNKDRRRNIQVRDLANLSIFLSEKGFKEYSLENIENEILYLGRNRLIRYPKFPIDFRTEDGASFVGDLITDGYLGSDLNCGYANSDINQIYYNLDTVHKIVTGKERGRKSLIKYNIYLIKKKAYCIKYPKSLSSILINLGIVRGNKVKNNYPLPKFLFYLDKKNFFKFFERVIVNEGCVLKTRIIITHSVANKKLGISNFIKNYKEILSKFGCETGKPYISSKYKVKNGEEHISWGIFITGRSLDIIKENCNLNMDYKNEEIKRRNSFTTRYSREDRFNQILKVCKELKVFKTKDIMEKLNLSQKCVTDYLIKAVGMGLISKIGNAQNTEYLFHDLNLY